MQLLGIQIFSIGEMVELANSWSQVARKWKRFVFINAMRLKLFETRYDYLWTFSDNRVDDFRTIFLRYFLSFENCAFKVE